MKEGSSEINTCHIERVKSNVTVTELTHGSQVFSQPEEIFYTKTV